MTEEQLFPLSQFLMSIKKTEIDEVVLTAFERLFKWANEMGRQGIKVDKLTIENKDSWSNFTCQRYLPIDQYNKTVENLFNPKDKDE